MSKIQKEVNDSQIVSIDSQLESLTSKSSKIRFLDSKGFSRSQIALMLEIRYQHVRNVLITPIKKTS